MLRLNNLEVVYDDVVLVLKGLSLSVPRGRIVCLLGTNGAGKSTTLKAVSGLLGPERGEVTGGVIALDGQPIGALSAAAIVRLGVVQVMEGRRIFEHLSVEENLRVGGYTGKRTEVEAGLESVYRLFPALRERRRSIAGYLSGGEQQMLAIGRALASRPRLLLMDEPSLGLAPRLTEEIFEALVRINRDEGTTILLVEQNAARALAIADYAYVMERGRVVLDGRPAELLENEDVKEFYLGLKAPGRRRSYREVKHYRRRKRWLS